MTPATHTPEPLAPSPLLHTLERALAWHEHLRAEMARLGGVFRERNVSPRLAAPWNHFVMGMEEHLKVEEEIVFPAVRALAEGRDPGRTDFESPLQEMQFELDELATISDALRSAAPEAGDLENELLDLLDQLDRHAEKEQHVIFPASVRLLSVWKTGAPPSSQRPTFAAIPSSTRIADEAPPMGLVDQPSVLFRVLRRFKNLVS